MYERNAVVLERFFDNLFGYSTKCNIKSNFMDYSELVEDVEKYKNALEEEETISQEYDETANQIRNIQKKQEDLDEQYKKVVFERSEIFTNIDENPNIIEKKFKEIEKKLIGLEEQMINNSDQFVNILSKFNEKETTRNICERNRRKIENIYNNKLNEVLDNFQKIDINCKENASDFASHETESIEKELKEKISKNGEKEKIPFNDIVISKAITLSLDIQKRETAILSNIYEKSNKLFLEIKNNDVKINKHKKIIKDSSSKLEFLSAIKEYLILFLDNERLTAVNGETEHNNLMIEACKNLEEDLQQINNLYTLLLQEIAKKANKKIYDELYNIEYLRDLEIKAREFDNKVKKLKLSITVINPNHWRIEGMKKIYEVFYKLVTENYARDLSGYNNDETEDEDTSFNNNEANITKDDIEDDIEIKEEKETTNKKQDKKEDTKSEIDRKIDIILGLDHKNKKKVEEDFEDETSENFDTEDDVEEIEDSISGDFESEKDDKKNVNIDEDDEEDDDDDFDEEDFDEYDDDFEEDFDEDFDEDDDDFEIKEEIDSEEDIEEDFDNENVEAEDEKANNKKHKKNIKKDDEEDEEDDDDFWNDEIFKNKIDKNQNNINSDEPELDIWGNPVKKKTDKAKKNSIDKTKNKKEQENNNETSWENEFIKLDNKKNKSKNTKKNSFLDKFLK